jgi:hypothetical protein
MHKGYVLFLSNEKPFRPYHHLWERVALAIEHIQATELDDVAGPHLSADEMACLDVLAHAWIGCMRFVTSKQAPRAYRNDLPAQRTPMPHDGEDR